MRFLHTREHATQTETSDISDDATDDLLVARSQQDPRAFAPLYERYFAAVYGYCFVELHDPEAAADAASQTFLQALGALDRYRPDNRFRSWLFTIAHNILLDARRRSHPMASLESATAVVDPSSPPDEHALLALDLERLDAALGLLRDEDLRVLLLRQAGLRGQEIGEVLGIGHAAARQRQARALHRLRAILGTSITLDAREVHREA
jgi:RNA polymerase sigma-70 factor (ECF subfamily)